jgi:hypothetical protein
MASPATAARRGEPARRATAATATATARNGQPSRAIGIFSG